MENASKALLMAGGILIALLVISLAVLAFKQMSDYQKSQSDLVKTGQLAEFNEQFAQYVRDDINGIDLVTLANKVMNFNQKESGPGEINYEEKIKLTIDMSGYQDKYNGTLFASTRYIIEKGGNSDFKNITNKYTELEQKYTIKTMGQLSSNLESLKNHYKKEGSDGKTIKEITGKEIKELDDKFRDNDFSDIEKYSEYVEFKSAEFKGKDLRYATNGQINEILFEYSGN